MSLEAVYIYLGVNLVLLMPALSLLFISQGTHILCLQNALLPSQLMLPYGLASRISVTDLAALIIRGPWLIQ